MAPQFPWKVFCSKWVIYTCYERDVQNDASKVWKATNFKRENQKLITDIGGGWYLKKCEKGTTTIEEKKTK